MHNFLKTKYYFINKFDTKIIDKLDKQTIIIYRNYTSKNENIRLLIKINNYCKERKIKFYLANNIKLAMKLKLDGVYIPSFNKSMKHLNYSIKNKFDIIGSAHNLKEIKTKEIQKVSKIFLSSIFKKNKNFLGVNRVKLLSNLTRKDIVVLGGISKKNLRLIKLLNCNEFAGISYFE